MIEVRGEGAPLDFGVVGREGKGRDGVTALMSDRLLAGKPRLPLHAELF